MVFSKDASKEIEVEVKISKPALETQPLTIKVPVNDNGTINTTSSDNSTMTVEPEEEKNSTSVEDEKAAPIPQLDNIVPKEQSVKPRRKPTPSKPASAESETFLDKLKKEKKKLDMNSHGAQKIDFKLKEVDPNAGSDAKEEERLIVPPLKTETIKD
jgi:hypothetical protein